MIVWPAKDPASVLDFTWTPPLDDGDTIVTFVPTVASGGITVTDPAPVLSGTKARMVVSGGTDMAIAVISMTVGTLGGDTHHEAGAIPIIDRSNETLMHFRMAYPAFAAVADGPIAYWLIQALTHIGNSWPEALRMRARAAYAAHKLVEAGALDTFAAAGITSFKSADFSLTFGASANLIGWNASQYGREYLALSRSAFAGPRLAW